MKSRNLWACLLVVGLLFAALPAAGQGTEQPPPVITCAQPEHDFGGVTQGEDVKHTFTIKNTGKGVLKITRARGG